MSFIDELRWRGMIHDMTPGVEEFLQDNYTTGYIGFDPTAPSLTIGNFVQIQLLTLFQKYGHRPIVLMGGATGRIGDPSFKSDERSLMTSDQIDHNLKFQKEQMEKFINFQEGENAALLLNNYDFYSEMNVLDFLRDVGKNLTVNYMMSKDSVKSRLETGLSFTEFSYQLLQAYDYLKLYNKYACRVQMGGSDQWGNITSGTEFIRRNTDPGSNKAYAVTTPLLTKSDGSKFGKSEEGNIWLDPELTSPYKFYQFWLNAADDDVEKFYKYFTLNDKEIALSNVAKHQDDPRQLKALLAEELTTRVHSREDYDIAKEVSEVLFNHRLDHDTLKTLKEKTLEKIAGEIPSFNVSETVINSSISELLAQHTTIMSSMGEVRRAIKSNAISVNKIKVGDHNHLITSDDLLYGRFMLLENGKKNKFIVEVA